MLNKKINKTIAIYLTVATFSVAQAQDSPRQDSLSQEPHPEMMMHHPREKETKTLFSNHLKVRQIGFYVAPEYQYANTNGNFNSLGGASFMLLLNQRFAVGPSIASAGGRNNANYGGLKMEYTVMPNALVHLSFPLIIGSASMHNDGDNMYVSGYYSGSSRGNHGSGDFDRNRGARAFMVQPGMNAEINLFKHLKAYAGASYRFIDGSQSNSLSSGVSFNTGLKLGVFDYRLKNKRHQEMRREMRHEMHDEMH